MQYPCTSNYDFLWNVIDKMDIFSGLLPVVSDSLKANIVLSDFTSEF